MENNEYENEQAFLDATSSNWDSLKKRLHVGGSVKGVVTHRFSFGVFLDIGEQFPGLLEITHMTFPNDKIIATKDLPNIGDKLSNLTIIGFRERDRQVYLEN